MVDGSDVADRKAARIVIGRAFTELQRIHVVVSNAGCALFGVSEDVSDAQIEQQLDTNLLGLIQLARGDEGSGRRD